jgi:hypothetical protein
MHLSHHPPHKKGKWKKRVGSNGGDMRRVMMFLWVQVCECFLVGA